MFWDAAPVPGHLWTSSTVLTPFIRADHTLAVLWIPVE